jgi:hypothetical protein
VAADAVDATPNAAKNPMAAIRRWKRPTDRFRLSAGFKEGAHPEFLLNADIDIAASSCLMCGITEREDAEALVSNTTHATPAALAQSGWEHQ